MSQWSVVRKGYWAVGNGCREQRMPFSVAPTKTTATTWAKNYDYNRNLPRSCLIRRSFLQRQTYAGLLARVRTCRTQRKPHTATTPRRNSSTCFPRLSCLFSSRLPRIIPRTAYLSVLRNCPRINSFSATIFTCSGRCRAKALTLST